MAWSPMVVAKGNWSSPKETNFTAVKKVPFLLVKVLNALLRIRASAARGEVWGWGRVGGSKQRHERCPMGW